MTHAQFPCKQCGAKVDFKPGSTSLQCPYCAHENPIPQSEEAIAELDYRAYLRALAAREPQQDVQEIKCQACAAEITLDPNVVSQTCPYCDTNIVAQATSNRQIKPKALIPFRLDHNTARTSFRQWVKSRWFAPNKLKRYARLDGKLNGVYVPYWTFDSDTTTYYTGQRGVYYYVTQTYTTTENGRTVTKTRQVRKTRWSFASGVVWNQFDDILVLASDSLPRKYTERLEPWDLAQAVPYDDAFLSGFKAESYQMGLPDGFDYACGIMDGHIRASIRRDIGGDEQRIHSVKTQHDNVTFKHLLLPIWVSAFRFGQKVYRFVVNGQTGEVQGERPYSWIKITLASLLGGGIVAALIWYFSQQ